MSRSEELRFRAGDAALVGTLTLPDEPVPGRLPWVLFVGSWLPRDRDGDWDRSGHPAWFAPRSPGSPAGPFSRLADALAARGVASFRHDPRGTGASEGAWQDVDLFTRIDDARDAIGAMRSRRELDLRRTAIVGHGEGAVIALSVAIGDPAIGAVGLIGAAARSARTLLRRGVAERGRSGRDREQPLVATLDRFSEEILERAERRESVVTLKIAGAPVTLRLSGWEQAIHTPAFSLATMLHRPVVLAHAEDDAWSPADESRLLVEVLRDAGNEPALQLLETGGHDLSRADDAAIGAFADALVERMEPRELPPVLVAIEEMGASSD
jgi:uncharacterized protein